MKGVGLPPGGDFVLLLLSFFLCVQSLFLWTQSYFFVNPIPHQSPERRIDNILRKIQKK